MSQIIFYVLFISSTIFTAYLSSYFSCKTNELGIADKNLLYTWLVSLIPVWTAISLYSKNIVFDGLIYDSVMVISYFVFLLYFSGKAVEMNKMQLVFLSLMLFSILGFKISED